jgi:hypothetical protein
MPYAIYCLKGHYGGSAEKFQPHSWEDVQRMALRAEVEGPEPPKRFCSDCGAALIKDCPQCSMKIVLERGKRPAFCASCGGPFPWTETALTEAKDFTDEQDELSADDKAMLKATFEDLTINSPKTEIAASRFKRILRKLAPDVAETIRKTIVEIASETAVKLIKP